LNWNPLGKLVTEKPVVFVGFDNLVESNQNRQNDDDVVKAYKSYFSWNSLKKRPVVGSQIDYIL